MPNNALATPPAVFVGFAFVAIVGSVIVAIAAVIGAITAIVLWNTISQGGHQRIRRSLELALSNASECPKSTAPRVYTGRSGRGTFLV